MADQRRPALAEVFEADRSCAPAVTVIRKFLQSGDFAVRRGHSSVHDYVMSRGGSKFNQHPDGHADRSRLRELAVRACRSGDLKAWDALVRYCQPLLRFRLPNSTEDDLQETWVRVWTARERFDPEQASFLTWITVIARRRVIDRLRRKQHAHTSLDAHGIPAAAPTPSDREHSATPCLMKCMEELPNRARELLDARIVHEMPYAAIASVFGFATEGSARSQVSRALDRLVQCVEECMKGKFPIGGGEDPPGEHLSHEALLDAALALDDEQPASALAHLQDCAECRARLDRIVSLLELVTLHLRGPADNNARSCPTDLELAAFVDGSPGGADLEEISQHVLGCATCGELVALPEPLGGLPTPTECAPRRRLTKIGLLAAASVAAAVLLRIGFPLSPRAESRLTLTEQTQQPPQWTDRQLVPDFTAGITPVVFADCRPLGLFAADAAEQACLRFEEGVAAQRAGNIEAASRSYAEAVELAPKFDAARANLAIVLAQGGDARAARQQLDALEIAADATTLYSVGAALVQNGMPGEALPFLDTALDLRPALANTSDARTRALCLLGRWRDADATIRERLSTQAPTPEDLFIAGYVAFRLGELDREIEMYRAAIGIDARFGKAWFNLGVALMNRAQAEFHEEDYAGARATFDESVSAYQKAGDAGLFPAQAQYSIGVVYGLQKRFAEAITALERGIELDPTDAKLVHALGIAALRSGDTNKALAQIEILRAMERSDLADHLEQLINP
ncbi:MAG: sigma-70 family RNA polymerase sigma factor [Planctomycetota bacterium]|nr:MAG: sigma-70 family RNA polymerase sigma factor [Planctomycetota bacterium]